MTDDHLDDEQLTALQDGVGPAEARAHMAGCDRCRRRSEALAEVAALVATPPPAPPATEREAAIAVALAEADRPAVPPRRPARRPAPAWLLPAAAVVALLALVAAVVPRLGSDDDSESAGQALSRGTESAEDGSGAATGGSTDQPGFRAAPPGAADLGSVDAESELARRVQDALTGERALDQAAGTAAPCPLPFEPGGRELGPILLRTSLLWRGQPAEVLSDGERAVVIVAGGCSVLADVALD